MLLNDGAGHFVFRALPRLAQTSPAFGVALAEVDGDGHADLYLSHNFYSPQPETGRMDGGLSLLLRGIGDGSFTTVWPKESGLIATGDAKALAVTDLNNDGWPDFVVAINNGSLLAFENRGLKTNRMLSVRLQGKPGNPTAIGARVTVRLDDGSAQTVEMNAGGGYLSQSTSTLTFGLSKDKKVKETTVRWPDGRTSAISGSPEALRLTIQQPGP